MHIDAPELRVLIADDHPVYRDGLAVLLGSLPGIEVVGTASDGVDALSKTGKLLPDVVVMDIQMPDIDGIQATRRLRQSGSAAAVLMLTMNEEDEAVLDAMRAGARGYLVKGAAQDEIERAIHAVAAGGAVFGSAIAEKISGLLADVKPAAPETFEELTAREREVLDLVAAGLNNSEIAARLFLSDKTVRNAVSTILSKLAARDRPQMIIRAREAGLGRG
ncbi:response regulator transcription factor [Microbacterium timonense]|jgi:DNA-binding NarL/FixJ family response regulator|uniref:response regulator transcription factor n=1 Tax=Microbacterium timonense TaxID=2086576 RepID=UPI00190EAF5B|nr:response regulator transcription factor [Microbacterium timonense]